MPVFNALLFGLRILYQPLILSTSFV